VTLTVGVLALQGDFEAHAKILAGLGADAREVRRACLAERIAEGWRARDQFAIFGCLTIEDA